MECLATLQVANFKLSSEVGQRVLLHSSRDFADTTASGVQRAKAVIPAIAVWIERLTERIATRGPLPMAESGLPPRFHRVCELFELSQVPRAIARLARSHRRNDAPTVRWHPRESRPMCECRAR